VIEHPRGPDSTYEEELTVIEGRQFVKAAAFPEGFTCAQCGTPRRSVDLPGVVALVVGDDSVCWPCVGDAMVDAVDAGIGSGPQAAG